MTKLTEQHEAHADRMGRQMADQLGPDVAAAILREAAKVPQWSVTKAILLEAAACAEKTAAPDSGG